jgi:membrane protein implicated in regulation of membrane protease activity
MIWERSSIMSRNEGTIDRALRIILGLVLLALVFVGPQTPWGWIGIVPLATGLIGWCPLYTLLGFNTCPMKK